MRKILLLTVMCLFGLFAVNAQSTPEDLTIVEVGADKNPANVKPADFLYFCTLKSERHNEIETKL